MIKCIQRISKTSQTFYRLLSNRINSQYFPPIYAYQFAMLTRQTKYQYYQYNHTQNPNKNKGSDLFTLFRTYIRRIYDTICQYRKSFIAILSGILSIVQAKQAIFTRIYESLKKKLGQNQQINKGKNVKQRIIEDLQSEYKRYDQILDLFTNQLSYCKDIESLIRQGNLKELICVESFSGNGFGKNIKRMINEEMHNKASKFETFYYINLNNPPIYEYIKNYEDKDWHEARELHYLLNYLISAKRSTSRPNILIIDQLQALSHFFDSEEKKEMLNNIIGQIYELQKKRKTKIICICNNGTFLERISGILRKSNKFDKFKQFAIGQLTNEDLKKIIDKRTKYKYLIQKSNSQNNENKENMQKIKQDIQKFQEIMKIIYKSHDSIIQIFRILKGSEVDYKQFYSERKRNILQKKYKSQLQMQAYKFQNNNPFYNQDIYPFVKEIDPQIIKQGHLPSMVLIKSKIQQISNTIIQQKENYLKKSMSCSFEQDLIQKKPENQISQKLIKREKQLQKVKYNILCKIFESGYEVKSEGAKKLKINLNNPYYYQAYLELNYDNILHGLVFNDLATFRAFERIKKAKQQKKSFFFF